MDESTLFLIQALMSGGLFITACLALLRGFPVAFTLAGSALVFSAFGILLSIYVDPEIFDMGYVSNIPSRIFGTMVNEVLIAVPLFIFMGVTLEKSKVAEELLENMGRLFGTLRGGLAISVTIVGALLAASTGIVGATVVTMGLLSLPTMLRNKYDPKLSCGSICAAGTLGQIIPPSIVLVLLGDVISNSYQQAMNSIGNYSAGAVSVGDLFAGALIPGLLLVGVYILYQLIYGYLKPEAAPPLELAEAHKGLSNTEIYLGILHALFPPVVLIVSVLGSILAGIATPTEAAAIGGVGSLLLGGSRICAQENNKIGKSFILFSALSLIITLCLSWASGTTEDALFDLRAGRQEIDFLDYTMMGLSAVLLVVFALGVFYSIYKIYNKGVLAGICQSTTEITSMVFIILLGAAVFSLVFRGLHGEHIVHELLISLPGVEEGQWILPMILVMLVMFILGFFLDFIEITFVVVPIIAPILLKLGVDPVWLGVMFAMNLQTSFLTPPFGFALFYLRGVAPPEVKTSQIYKGVLPFILIQIAALIVLSIFPELVTWLPSVVFD